MIPSGYKEDVVYSQIPTDGSGDLSFTRASNGTRVNSAGLVEVCPWNLVLDSETFNTGNWIQYQAGISANTTTAPNGTSTADSLVDNTANDIHINFQLLTLNAGVNTISVYAKASTLSNIVLYSYDNVSQFYFSNKFDLANGTTTGANQSIESVGNGWYRCSFTFTTVVSGTHYVYVALNNGTSNSFAGTGSGAVFIWGYQANIGSTAKPYFPTTDRLNVPRLTYQNGGGGCPSLLLEKQSTNLQRSSQDFTNASYWSLANITATANTTSSPDGTINADSIIEDTANSRHELYSDSISFTGANAISFYIKTNGRQYISVLSGGDPSLGGATFDVVNGVVSATSGGTNATISAMGNGWYYCAFTTSRTGTSQIYWCFRTTGGSPTVETYTGNGTSGFYIWGAQVEASSYPTSYIPTTSASATRVADACYKTGISSLIGQTEGVMFLDFLAYGLPTVDQYFLNISDGSTGKLIYIGFYSNILVARIIDNYNLVVNINVSLSTNTRYKVAFAYKANDCVLYINGTNSGSDTSATIPATSIVSLNDFGNNGTYKANDSQVYTTRLSNSELASLTTI